jgi:hypothetical protein
VLSAFARGSHSQLEKHLGRSENLNTLRELLGLSPETLENAGINFVWQVRGNDPTSPLEFVTFLYKGREHTDLALGQDTHAFFKQFDIHTAEEDEEPAGEFPGDTQVWLHPLEPGSGDEDGGSDGEDRDGFLGDPVGPTVVRVDSSNAGGADALSQGGPAAPPLGRHLGNAIPLPGDEDESSSGEFGDVFFSVASSGATGGSDTLGKLYWPRGRHDRSGHFRIGGNAGSTSLRSSGE